MDLYRIPSLGRLAAGLAVPVGCAGPAATPHPGVATPDRRAADLLARLEKTPDPARVSEFDYWAGLLEADKAEPKRAAPPAVKLSAPKEQGQAPQVEVDVVARLDKEAWSQAEDITGAVTVTLRWPKHSPHTDRAVIGMGRPDVSLGYRPGQGPWELLHITITPEDPPGRDGVIGKPYRHAFRIAPSKRLDDLSRAVGKRIALFEPGKRTLQLGVQSATPSWNSPVASEVPYSATIEAPFTVVAAPEAVISARDLLKTEALTKADRFTQGLMAEYCHARGVSFDEIPFLAPLRGPLVLAGHDGKPFLCLVEPSQVVELQVEAGAGSHNFHPQGGINIMLGPGSAFNFRAPAQPAMYRVLCDIHHTTLGWFFVRR